MLKILSAQQTRALDAYTMAHEPIASIDLMERASQAFVTWFTERFPVTERVGIVCGTGNNGGDGLAIARLLKDWSYTVQVWVVKGPTGETEDFKFNRTRIGSVALSDITTSPAEGIFSGCDILIDALFGSGLSRPVEGIYAEVIRRINEADATRIAVDTPSGLRADAPSQGEIVQAGHTVSFQLPKLGFLFPNNAQFVGQWCVVDIGLSKEFLKQEAVSHYYLTPKAIHRRLKDRSIFDHKGSFGHALLVAGSLGKMGAAVLASRAALRAGVGLLTVHAPTCGYVVLQGTVPEAMVMQDVSADYTTSVGSPEKYTTIGIGPGLGQAQPTVAALGKLLRQYGKPMVIDADALNILAANRELLQALPPGSILTPHPKEFERLAGPWKDDFQRLELQKGLAERLKSVIVLKGAHTSIATPDKTVYFNATGNPGMATGGTGDVLTGLLTGLLAQGYTAIDAAIIGVYLHGLAGDIAVRELGQESLIASDLIDAFPDAFSKIRHSGKRI
jgi:ADP-dependent NAD(P)H-hydrate dehydratase / NAD(P)H-hydrate epimerase